MLGFIAAEEVLLGFEVGLITEHGCVAGVGDEVTYIRALREQV